MKMLNYGIIGFGGLGKVHFGNAKAVKEFHKDIKLVAVCDIEESKFTTKTATNLGKDNDDLDLSECNLYTDYKEMIEKEKLDFVICAVPTYLHDTIAIYAMEKGLNVFSEKPMAISVEKGQKMVEAARKNNVKLMIGQCVRFWPEYRVIKELTDSGKYGKVVKAEFRRISPEPIWGWENWYMDYERSGGATLDLHVHDMDFINYAFGKPKAVTSVATNCIAKEESMTTFCRYDDKVVIATGDWGHCDTYKFNFGFLVRFEKATLELRNNVLTLYTKEKEEEIKVNKEDAYVNEIVDFISCIKENRESKVNPPESTVETLKITFAEKLSAKEGKEITL